LGAAQPVAIQEKVEVFVSYSSEDRPRVLPLVDSLIARGVRVWIDRYKIPGGAEYTQEIPAAIGLAKVVVLFASGHAFSSRNVRRELDLAWKKEKPILPMFLDKIKVPVEFEWYLEAVQFVTLYESVPDEWADELYSPLARFGIGQAASPPAPRSAIAVTAIPAPQPGMMAIGPLTPYLVDRIQQERHLRQALTRHSQNAARRPLILVAHGRLEQAIHEYVQRVQGDSLPKALKFAGYFDHLKWLNLPWTKENWENDPTGAIHSFEDDIEAELQLRPNSWPGALVEAVINLRSTVVLCYRAVCQRWTDAHLRTLQAYAQTWACLPELAPGYPLIVLFVLQYQAQAPSLFDRISRWQRHRTGPQRQIQTLATLDGPDLAVSILPELGNVVFADIEHWILNEVRPPDPVRMIRAVREILKDPELIAGQGLPMSRLVDRLYAIVDSTAKEQLA
jgi:hypothetical protein